jgi:hypothetical protein
LYSREEVKKLKEEFWTTFGQYMRAVPSSDFEKVNWVNYKTGVKHLFFRMDADNKMARIGIDIVHPDAGMRSLMYAQFVEFKNVLEDISGESWKWEEQFVLSDKEMATIMLSIDGASIFRKDDWPDLISFFKPRIIALDEFWSLAKHTFDVFK